MNNLAARTAAHDTYTLFVQHRIDLVAGADRIDVTVDLTFFEEWSLRERRRMDANADGNVSKIEEKGYLDQLAPELSKKVRLLISGREIALAPLYDPELDLLGNRKSGPGHHRLKLFFFAPSAPTLKRGDELMFQEEFWPEAKALLTFEVRAADGGALEKVKRGIADAGSSDDPKGISLTARCLKPPRRSASPNAAPKPSS